MVWVPNQSSAIHIDQYLNKQTVVPLPPLCGSPALEVFAVQDLPASSLRRAIARSAGHLLR